MFDNFRFQLIDEIVGYNSSRDKTNVVPGMMVRGSQNVYKKLSGTVATRFGLKRRGAADSTFAGTKSAWTWNTTLGEIYPLRVNNNKLQVEWDGVAEFTIYDLLLTGGVSPAATLTRFVFDSWWYAEEAKDRAVMVRGDSNFLSWSGGMAIAQAQVVGLDTLTLADTTSTWAQKAFATDAAAEFKFYINGSTIEYTYTAGTGTNQLTGITPALPIINANDVIIQSVMITSWSTILGVTSTYISDFLRVLGNQILVGSYTSRQLYLSADVKGGGFPDFTNAGSFVSGDPDLIVIDNPATGIGIRKGSFWVSSGTSDWYEITPNSPVPISFTDPISGTARFIITKVSKKPSAALTAAYSHEFIDMIGDDIVYLGKDKQVRVIGDYNNAFSTKYPSISQAINDELFNEDFTGGHLTVIGDFIHITAPNNGRDYMYQKRDSVDENGNVVAERLWHPPHIRSISRFTTIAGVVYGHSSANPQIYQIWDTNQWFDDDPSGEPVPYTCVMRMAYRHTLNKNGGVDRVAKGRFDKSYYEGYMSPGTSVYGNIYFDYQGSSGLQNVVINSNQSPADFFSGISGNSLGSISLGDNPLGDGLVTEANDQSLLPKFRAICDINPTDSFENELEVYSTDPDARWEILALGTNLQQSPSQSVEIRKSS